MIVHPLCQWPHSLPSENVSYGVCQSPIYSSGRCEAKIVADVDHKLVIGLQPDDEPRPLFRLDGDCPVCLCDVTYRGLRAWRKMGDEQSDC